jgi:nucleoside-diphosphate-sugar epimerase
MNKKILITGGAGYIGSHVVNNLLKSDYKIIVLDKLNFDNKSLAKLSKNKNLTIIAKDIRDYNNIEEHFENVDTVIHLAALVGEAACKISEKDTIAINYEATEQLAKISIKKKIKNFIFMSTASSYGVQDVEEIADEKTNLNPVSLYAKTKIDCEQILLQKYSDDLNITIFRPSTVYGDSHRMRFDLILNHLVKDAYFRKEIKVFGPKMVRPLMWVGEPARVYKIIIEDKEHKFRSQIFNLGYNKENYEKIQIAKIVQENFFKNIELKIVQNDLDLRSYRLNFNKMKNFFNLEPYTDIQKESYKIIKNFEEKKYGDVGDKKYYNA